MKMEKQKRELEGKVEDFETVAEVFSPILLLILPEIRPRQAEIDDLKKHIAVEHDRKNKVAIHLLPS